MKDGSISQSSLVQADGKLQLQLTDGKPFYIDFLSGKQAYRHQHTHARQEHLLRAIGWQQASPPSVIDVTAGLGRDAVLMAQFGCLVTAIEQNPIVFQLLEDGLRRLTAEHDLPITLLHGNAPDLLPTLSKPDVVYCDPMFPARKKSALVKRELQLLQEMVTEPQDNQALFDAAIASGSKRVVVKRPAHAPPFVERSPDFVYEGKSVCFEVYLASL